MRLPRSLLIAVILLTSTNLALSDDLAGQASVIDGDTLEIHGIRIRLWGIDAPESSQLCRGEDSLQYRCGTKAANDLDAFIARRPANCVPISLDQYGRTVASCSVDRTDLAEWLVYNGLSIDWPQYSKGRFDPIQRKAEHEGRGMWSGSYVEPWLYRVCIRAGGRPIDCSDDANAHLLRGEAIQKRRFLSPLGGATSHRKLRERRVSTMHDWIAVDRGYL